MCWADSTGRCNISITEVLNGTTAGLGLDTNRAADNAVAWQTSCQAVGDEAGVLEMYCSRDGERRRGIGMWHVLTFLGPRWFRDAGGMPPIELEPPSGRYVSFSEREEIALLRAQNHGVREIARRLGRSAFTISRELRRNAATRGGTLTYRAIVAQWNA